MMAKKPKGSRKPVRIEVTQRHIDESLQKSSSHCMIAEAIKEAIPQAKFVSVDLQTIRWSDPDKGLRYTALTPRLPQEMLVAFDQGLGDVLKPFAFQVKPVHVTGVGNRRGHAPAEMRGELVLPPKSNEEAAEPTMTPDTQSASTVAVDDSSTVSPSPPKMPRRRRARLSVQRGNEIPATLGGQPPPISVLQRREFGLRVLRR